MDNQFSKPLQTKIDRLKKKQRPLKLGQVDFSSPLLLAPMSSICNAPFRLLMEELGAGGTVSELISCHGIVRKNEKTTKMLFVDPREKNVGLQIFGEEDSMMAEAAQVAQSFSPKFIDINMGCPVRKVVTKGGGSALLREPKKLAPFFSKIKKNLNIPLSIKIRTGWDEANINADEIINVAHNEGIEFVTIHGRTRAQQYKGKADWDYLEKVSSNSPLPVIGNGDLNVKNDIIKRLQKTRCQAFMIGRAALRNPFIFLEGIQDEDDETTFSPQDIYEVSERLFFHLRNTIDRERVLLVQIRKHLIWLAAGYNNVSHFRNKLFRTDEIEDIRQISQEFFLSLGSVQKNIKNSQSFMMGGHG